MADEKVHLDILVLASGLRMALMDDDVMEEVIADLPQKQELEYTFDVRDEHPLNHQEQLPYGALILTHGAGSAGYAYLTKVMHLSRQRQDLRFIVRLVPKSSETWFKDKETEAFYDSIARLNFDPSNQVSPFYDVLPSLFSESMYADLFREYISKYVQMKKDVRKEGAQRGVQDD